MITAKLLPHKGVPTIFVNDTPVEPTMFFARLSVPDLPSKGPCIPRPNDSESLPFYDRLAVSEEERNVCYSEIARAARSGVHLFTLFMFVDPDLSGPAEQSNAEYRKWLRRVVEIDPEALIIPRVLTPYDHTSMGVPDSENELFSDGADKPQTQPYVRSDFVSDLWRKRAILLLERFIASVQADEVLRDHVIGYHYAGGQTSEWFQRRYWEGVLNVSEANARCFRRWLKAKYATDEALSAAWGQDAVIDQVQIPADLPSCRSEFQTVGLMEGIESQRFIDYLDYYSDEVVTLLEEAAAAVKRATNGNSLFIAFYGYHFEISGAHSGHFSLARLLRCPDVDIITSPISYANRNERGVGAFMNEAASVLAAGKLWLDESDYRMPVVKLPPVANSIPYILNLTAAREVVLREYGKLALFGAGTWWMDLFDAGWFDDDALWEYIAEGRRFYAQMRESARPDAVSEVYYIVDEKAMSLAGDTWCFATNLLTHTRDKAYLTGLSYDLRLIEDFLSGKLDGAKLYIFLTPFRMSRPVMEAVHSKLKASGATALWMFGFGLNSDKAALKELTGFDFTITPESMGSISALGADFRRVPVSPLTVPANGEILGVYPDRRTAFAQTREAGYPSYFFGGTTVDIDIVRYAARQAGARTYMPAGDCFNRRGPLAYLHTASGGEKSINFGCAVTELRSGVRYEAGECVLKTAPGQTFLFQIHEN